MRPWHHIIAAFVGLVLAAALVTVAFREADEGGSAQSGDAPAGLRSDASGATNPECGKRSPAQSRSPKAVNEAKTALPDIYDTAGVQRNVQSDVQRRWFARIQAFGGNCVDEVTVAPKELGVSMTFAKDVSPAQRGAFLIGAMDASFRAPLARRLLKLSWASSTADGEILIRSGAWTQFQQSYKALKLPYTLDGLRAYAKRVGLTKQELAIT